MPLLQVLQVTRQITTVRVKGVARKSTLNSKVVHVMVEMLVHNVLNNSFIQMLSQKLMGWLSKNFILQGLVFFQGRRHTYGMSSS
jgi:hypothetical protein